MTGRKKETPLAGRRADDAIASGVTSSNIAPTGPGCKGIGRKKLTDRQLSERIGKADGFVLRRPEVWR